VIEPSAVAVYAGLAIGIAFGALALMSGFCLLSGLRGWWVEGDGRKIRTFATAAAVAVIATQLLAVTGLVDLSKSIYLQRSFSPALIMAGGLLFGYGMVLANGCASRAVVLLGRGNLRSLVVLLIIGLTAQATLKGLIAPARLAFLNWSTLTPPAVALNELLSRSGLDDARSVLLAALVVSSALIAFAMAHERFRRSPAQVLTGLGIGLLIAAGWFVTGCLGADDFNPVPVATMTFVAPVADSIQYMMLSTGLTLSFGIALTFGVVLGSFAASIATRSFKLEGFTSAQHMLRSVTGAALMGSGGAMA
jgi:uncharacterized membrane protein YedE/YeeE